LVATHASVLGNLRRHAEALILGNYLLNFFRTYGGQEPVTPDAVGHCQLIRAVALQGLGNWAEAADAYGAVLHYYQGKNQRETARALMNRGLMLYNLGRWREALADYDAVLPLYTALRLPEQVACCQMNRGNTLRNLNEYPAAIPAYDAAIAYFRTSPPNRSLEAACLANRGSALMDLGRYHEALAGLAAARAIYADLGEEDEQARCWANLGITVMELGRPTQALEAYDAALDTFLKRQMRRDAALCAANRAAALLELGRDEEALQGYTAAVNLFAADGVQDERAKYLLNRARLLHQLGRSEEAAKDLEEARAGLNALAGRRAEYATSLLSAASLLYVLGRTAEALATLNQVEVHHLKPDRQYEYHGAYAAVLWQSGQRDGALAHLSQARQILRQARSAGEIDETASEFVRKRLEHIFRAVYYALELGQPALAFEAVQDGKACMLGDLLGRRGDSAAEEPAEVTANRRLVTEWLRDHPPREDEPAEVCTESAHRRGAYLRTWQLARQARRAGQPARADSLPVPLKAIQDALPADWALLDFWQRTAEEFHVFVVTRNGLRVETLPFPTQDPLLLSRLYQLHEAMRQPSANPRDRALDDVQTYLFHPLRPLLASQGIRGLYLVPHGPLHGLPLHLARRSEGGRAVYLNEEFEIAYLPSAALLPQLPPRGHWDGTFLSLANPDQGTAASLPFGEWEANELGRRLGSPAGRIHAGKAATFARTGDWSTALLVHFSCHGFAYPGFSPLSHLRLSDDLLLAHDVVYRRPPLRNGALVLLNGCETAVRDWRAVDEGLGLMSAFLLRGASLVLASQWVVLDTCAAELVTTFTAAVAGGASPARALQQAQRQVRGLKAGEIVARCEELLRLFPAGEQPHEAAKIHREAARASLQAGSPQEAHRHAEQAAAQLRRVDRGREADLLLASFRQVLAAPALDRAAGFDQSAFWGAFQLIGRVT
jgi:CHAT domain-containing protein/tetratricopeptide (TPR) repeat protein